MKKCIVLLFCVALLSTAGAAPKSLPNVVIEEMTENVRFVPDKAGTGLKCVEQTTEYVFRANRAADKALAMAYYNDDISVDKATGGTVSYDSFIGDEFFSDSKACFVSVPLKKAGAKGKASMRVTHKKPEFFSRLLIFEIYDIEHYVVKFEMPESLAGRYRLIEKNFPEGKFTKEESRNGGKLTVTYTLSDIKKEKRFNDAPSLSVTAPQIQVLGHFPDVNALYRYLHSYIPSSDPAGHSVADKAAEVTAGCSDDAGKISAVNDFVHDNIRYVAVEHGEFGHRPDLASEVLRKRFGDCKGSAILMRDMLRSLGFDARLVWIGTRSTGVDWTDVPNVSSGNHMITAVMLPGDSVVYLDGTAKYTPAAYPPASLGGRQTIIEHTDQECIVGRVPLCPPERNLNREIYVMETDGDRLSVEGERLFKGFFSGRVRDLYDNSLPGKRQEACDRIFGLFFSGGVPENVGYAVSGDSVTITGKTSVAGAVRTAGATKYVDLGLAQRIDDLRFNMDDRTSGGIVGNPSITDCSMTLRVPDNMALGDLPQECTVDNEWISATLTNDVAPDGRSLTRRLHLSLKNGEVPFARMEDYNSDIRRLRRACQSNVVLNNL